MAQPVRDFLKSRLGALPCSRFRVHCALSPCFITFKLFRHKIYSLLRENIQNIFHKRQQYQLLFHSDQIPPGALPSQLLGFLEEFYSCSHAIPRDDKAQFSRGNPPLPNIDRAFQEKVWGWLAKHPDVSVGKDRSGNKLTLTEVESRNARLSNGAGGVEQQPEEPGKKLNGAAQNSSKLTVTVALSRSWIALTGHRPDNSRVSPFDFALLSIIATRKENGILQPDLVKESGQDKRSVPKRTDTLSRNGYIEKRPILVRGLNTSILILRKFAPSSQDSLAKGVEPPKKYKAPTTMGGVDNHAIDMLEVVHALFALLKDVKIIVFVDLKQKMNMMDPWRSKTLAKTVRKWESLGFVKRVKAELRYEHGQSSRPGLYNCVKLLREPAFQDIEKFYSSHGRLTADDLQGTTAEGENLDGDEEAGDLSEMQNMNPDPPTAIMIKVTEVRKTIPQWTPDRNITNMIFDIIDQSGSNGISSMVCFRVNKSIDGSS